MAVEIRGASRVTTLAEGESRKFMSNGKQIAFVTRYRPFLSVQRVHSNLTMGYVGFGGTIYSSLDTSTLCGNLILPEEVECLVLSREGVATLVKGTENGFITIGGEGQPISGVYVADGTCNGVHLEDFEFVARRDLRVES